MSIQDSYQNLLKFDDDRLELGQAISDDRLEQFEKKLGYTLTSEFKYMMKKHNGFSVSGCEVYGIGDEFKSRSLNRMYDLIVHRTRILFQKVLFPFHRMVLVIIIVLTFPGAMETPAPLFFTKPITNTRT